MNEKAGDRGNWEKEKGNEPENTSAKSGEDVNVSESEPSTGGTATKKASELNRAGSPGRTPGKAEGVEDPEDEGNQ